MSRERELLKRIVESHYYGSSQLIVGLKFEIEELLAQPEPEPVAWMNEDYEFCVNKEQNDGYPTALYTETPKSLTFRQGLEEYKKGYAKAEIDLKREPLSDSEILKNTPHLANFERTGVYGCLMFEYGAKFAEKAHGIGSNMSDLKQRINAQFKLIESNQGHVLTLRDHFAGLAMQALISVYVNTENEEPDDDCLAYWAYRNADAMLKERERVNG